MAAPEQLPRWVPTGTDAYYQQREADFDRRHPAGSAPTYYLTYGDKCLHQFRAAKPEFTEHGQRWLETTLSLLQEAMEARRRLDPGAFGLLELDDDAFQDFAFSTHAPAYLAAGIAALPAADLWRVLKTPDLSDLISPDGLAQIFDVLAGAAREDLDGLVDDADRTPPIRRLVASWHRLTGRRSLD